MYITQALTSIMASNCSLISFNLLRITRSDMNCQRVKYILRGLSDISNLEMLDFSHCKIGDEGASSIAKFIMRRDALRNLILVDNVFGKFNNNKKYICDEDMLTLI